MHFNYLARCFKAGSASHAGQCFDDFGYNAFLDVPAVFADRHDRGLIVMFLVASNKSTEGFEPVGATLFDQRRQCAVDCRRRRLRFAFAHDGQDVIGGQRLGAVMQDRKNGFLI